MGSADTDQAPSVDPGLDSRTDDRLERFRVLFDAHYDYVWTSLRRFGVPERDREDLANELFVRVYERMDTLDPGRSPKPWLCAFAVRMASEYRRLARHRVERVADTDRVFDGVDAAVLPEQAIEDGERRQLVLTALQSIDLDKRAVLVLHELDEIPIPEVARALGIPEGTAYSRLRAGRTELSAELRRLMEGSLS